MTTVLKQKNKKEIKQDILLIVVIILFYHKFTKKETLKIHLKKVTIPLVLRFFYVFLTISLAANIIVPVVGFYWGFISIVITTIWVGSSWKWQDAPFFIGIKTFFFGCFVVSLVDVLRLYYLAETESIGTYLNVLKWSLGLSGATLFVAAFLMFINQLFMHKFYKLHLTVSAWIDKEKKIYERTWIHRKIVFFRKKVRGFFWRIKNKYGG